MLKRHGQKEDASSRIACMNSVELAHDLLQVDTRDEWRLLKQFGDGLKKAVRSVSPKNFPELCAVLLNHSRRTIDWELVVDLRSRQ